MIAWPERPFDAEIATRSLSLAAVARSPRQDNGPIESVPRLAVRTNGIAQIPDSPHEFTEGWSFVGAFAGFFGARVGRRQHVTLDCLPRAPPSND